MKDFSRHFIMFLVGFVVVGSSLVLLRGITVRPSNTQVLGASDVVDLLAVNINYPAGWGVYKIVEDMEGTNWECVGGGECAFVEYRAIESNSALTALRISSPVAIRARFEGASPAKKQTLKFLGEDVDFTIEEFVGTDSQSNISNFQIYGCTRARVCLQAGPFASDSVQNAREFDTFVEVVGNL